MAANRTPMIIKGMKWNYSDLMELFYNVELAVEYKGEKVFIFVSLSEDCEMIIVKNHEIMPEWIEGNVERCTADALYYSQTEWQYGADDGISEEDIKNDLNSDIDASEYRNAIYFTRLAVEAFESKYGYEELHQHNECDVQNSANEFLRLMVFPNNDLNSAEGDNLSLPEYARAN